MGLVSPANIFRNKREAKTQKVEIAEIFSWQRLRLGRRDNHDDEVINNSSEWTNSTSQLVTRLNSPPNKSKDLLKEPTPKITVTSNADLRSSFMGSAQVSEVPRKRDFLRTEHESILVKNETKLGPVLHFPKFLKRKERSSTVKSYVNGSFDEYPSSDRISLTNNGLSSSYKLNNGVDATTSNLTNPKLPSAGLKFRKSDSFSSAPKVEPNFRINSAFDGNEAFSLGANNFEVGACEAGEDCGECKHEETNPLEESGDRTAGGGCSASLLRVLTNFGVFQPLFTACWRTASSCLKTSSLHVRGKLL